MEKNDVKLIWQEINSNKECFNEKNVQEIIKEKHSKIISKMLNTQQLRMLIYAMALIILTGLMLYALGILKLNLSVQAIIPLSLTGLFLFLKTSIEFNNYRLLKSTTNDASLKESIHSFKQKLNHTKMIDFISTLIYCYGWATGIVFILLNDLNGIIRSMCPFLILLILIFLIIPWFIKHSHPRYNNLYQSLEKDIEYLKST